MKIPKLRFSLASVFVGLTLLGIVLGVYRHYLHCEERIAFHMQMIGKSNDRLLIHAQFIPSIEENRSGLLAGNEDGLQGLRGRIRFQEQALEIAYVPAQLAILDNKLIWEKAENAQEELVKNYHTQLVADYEQSRWRPWRRVTELASPPQTMFGKDPPSPRLLGK